jgi:hypothetical protein
MNNGLVFKRLQFYNASIIYECHKKHHMKPGHSAERVHLMLKDVHQTFNLPSVRLYQVL